MTKGWNPGANRWKIFWRMVDRKGPNECWPWALSVDERGYGHVTVAGWHTTAHRAAYACINGRPPRNAVVMHTCDNPPCCNPAHLRIGSQADNMMDKHLKGRHGDARNFGEQGSAKLTDAQVAEIRQRYASENISQRRLAAEYGVGSTQIARIVNGESRLPGMSRSSPLLAEIIKSTAPEERGAIGEKGRRPRPPRLELRKANFELAELIRVKRKAGATYRQIAEEFGLGQTTIRSIVEGRTYTRP